MKILTYLAIFGLGIALNHNLLAQSSEEKLIPEAALEKTDKKQGWSQYLGLSLYGTVNENSNVVGKNDGQTTTGGLKLASSVDFKKDSYEWLNSFNLIIAFSRNPQIPRYLKSEDQLDLESLYKYYFASTNKLGSFAQFKLDTVSFDGYDTQAELTNYKKELLDGSNELFESNRVKLTDRFRPLKLKQSAGLLSSPVKTDELSLDLRVGLGLRQVLADGQFVVNDKASTPERDLFEIKSYEKAGYEFGAVLSGATKDKKLSYSLSANLLFPVYESQENDNRSNFDKRIMDLDGKLSFYLLEWASLDYLLKVVRDPDIVSKAQLSQSLLFSVNHVLVSENTP